MRRLSTCPSPGNRDTPGRDRNRYPESITTSTHPRCSQVSSGPGRAVRPDETPERSIRLCSSGGLGPSRGSRLSRRCQLYPGVFQSTASWWARLGSRRTSRRRPVYQAFPAAGLGSFTRSRAPMGSRGDAASVFLSPRIPWTRPSDMPVAYFRRPSTLLPRGNVVSWPVLRSWVSLGVCAPLFVSYRL